MIHMRNTFVPKHWQDLASKQKEQILKSFIFVEQNKNGTDKGRMVLSGNEQHGFIS